MRLHFLVDPLQFPSGPPLSREFCSWSGSGRLTKHVFCFFTVIVLRLVRSYCALGSVPQDAGAGVAVRRADRRTGALPAVLSGREGAKKLGLRLSSPFSNHSGPHRSVKHVDSLLGVFWYAHAFPQECQEVKREIGSPVHPIFNVMPLFSHLQLSSFPLSSV